MWRLQRFAGLTFTSPYLPTVNGLSRVGAHEILRGPVSLVHQVRTAVRFDGCLSLVAQFPLGSKVVVHPAEATPSRADPQREASSGWLSSSPDRQRTPPGDLGYGGGYALFCA